jgi:hypothetical protein
VTGIFHRLRILIGIAGTCQSTPVGGGASVTCACARPRPAACAGVPPAVARRKARLCDVVAGGSAKRVRASVRKLAAAMGAVTRLRRKGRLSAPCADALAADLRDARDRAARMLGHGGKCVHANRRRAATQPERPPPSAAGAAPAADAMQAIFRRSAHGIVVAL